MSLDRGKSAQQLEESRADGTGNDLRDWKRYVAGAPPQGALGTVRIAALLRIVAAHNTEGLKLNEIARLSGLELSTAHRIISALHGVGFLARAESGRRYHLGPLLFELFTTALPHFNPTEICTPAMVALAERVGDTVYLSVRSGLYSICTDRREGSYPIRTCTLNVGQHRPLGVGAGSLALLSALPEAEAALVIDQCAKLYPEYGLTPTDVAEAMARVRADGHVYNAAVTSSDVLAVGLPITGRTGYPFAALSITATASRMTPERAVEIVTIMSEEIAAIQNSIREMGYV